MRSGVLAPRKRFCVPSWRSGPLGGEKDLATTGSRNFHSDENHLCIRNSLDASLACCFVFLCCVSLLQNMFEQAFLPVLWRSCLPVPPPTISSWVNKGMVSFFGVSDMSL